MWARSEAFDRAIRSGGVPLLNKVTSQIGQGREFVHRVDSGSVAITAAQGVRRTLTLAVENTGSEWGALEPAGAWVRVFRGPRYLGGLVEYLPMGVFRVDTEQISYSNGLINLTCPDRWVVIQEATFDDAERPRSDTFVQEIVRLLAPGGTPVRVLTSRDAELPRAAFLYGPDRAAAIYSLADAIGVDVAYAADGVAEIRDLPTHPRAVDWLVDYGQNGVLMSADRSRTRQYSRNRIRVVSTSTSGVPPFQPVVVEDVNPRSPTFVHGPFGVAPLSVSSDLVTTADQARLMGQSVLARKIGLQSQVTWTAIGHPALDVLDSVGVAYRELPGMSRTAEAHVIDTLTQPLDGTGMTGTCRAVGAATDDIGPARTYVDLDAEANSYQELDRRYATYADMLKGVLARGVRQ